MRRVLFLFSVLLVLPLLGSDSPKEYDDRTESNDALDGTWQQTGEELCRQPRTFSPCKTTFHAGAYREDHDGGLPSRGSYSLPSTGHLDCVASDGRLMGRTVKCIYRIDGDKLTIARLLNGYDEQYPPAFGGNFIFVRTYKRVR